MKMKRIAFVRGDAARGVWVDLITVQNDAEVIEVVRALEPNMPLQNPDTLKVLGWSKGNFNFPEAQCLVLEDQAGRCIKFRSVQNLQNAALGVLDVLEAHQNETFKVVKA